MSDADQIVTACTALFAGLDNLPVQERIDAINRIRSVLHQHSPHAGEPVDCVLWLPEETVRGNDYNPNSVAPPEMALLEQSVMEDGYTQPIVAWESGAAEHEVVDGFHRHMLPKRLPMLRARLHGRLPVALIKTDRAERHSRMASTIRHNRARGTHGIDLMVQMVGELSQIMSDAWIMKHLGMDMDELLRLKQISGIASLFKRDDFSQAWAANSADSARYEKGEV